VPEAGLPDSKRIYEASLRSAVRFGEVGLKKLEIFDLAQRTKP